MHILLMLSYYYLLYVVAILFVLHNERYSAFYVALTLQY